MSEAAATQEILQPKGESQSPKDRIKEWASSLKALVSRNPSKVIRALAHPNVLLPETPPTQEDQLIPIATETTLPNEPVPQPNQEAVVLQEQGEATIPDVAPETPSSNPVEDFDLLGRAEAAESGTSVLISNSLDCFPDRLQLHNTEQGGDVASWWQLIKSNAARWEIAVWRQPDGSIKVTFDFLKNEFVQEKSGIHYDSRIADVPVTDTQLNADARTEGWRIARVYDFKNREWLNDIPNQDDEHIVRGMTDDEMRKTLQTGLIKSRGDLVNEVGQKSEKGAWTFFFPGSNTEGSFDYAARDRIFSMASFTKPSYVISMRRTEHIKVSPGDLYSEEPLPVDGIERMYEIRPISVDGNFNLDIYRYQDTRLGTVYAMSSVYEMACPKVVYAYKEVSPDEVRKSLKIDPERT